jgi:hypothetical protein
MQVQIQAETNIIIYIYLLIKKTNTRRMKNIFVDLVLVFVALVALVVTWFIRGPSIGLLDWWGTSSQQQQNGGDATTPLPSGPPLDDGDDIFVGETPEPSTYAVKYNHYCSFNSPLFIVSSDNPLYAPYSAAMNLDMYESDPTDGSTPNTSMLDTQSSDPGSGSVCEAFCSNETYCNGFGFYLADHTNTYHCNFQSGPIDVNRYSTSGHSNDACYTRITPAPDPPTTSEPPATSSPPATSTPPAESSPPAPSTPPVATFNQNYNKICTNTAQSFPVTKDSPYYHVYEPGDYTGTYESDPTQTDRPNRSMMDTGSADATLASLCEEVCGPDNTCDGFLHTKLSSTNTYHCVFYQGNLGLLANGSSPTGGDSCYLRE